LQIAVLESDANLWRENGMLPPLPNSKAEKEWVRVNKPVPYTEEDNVRLFFFLIEKYKSKNIFLF
jgi:hypothetical protein